MPNRGRTSKTKGPAPGAVPEESKEVVQPVPDWAVKVLQAAIREYRYTGDYMPGTSEEQIVIGVRRGDQALGRVSLRHTMVGPKHYLRLRFESMDDAVQERLTARSLDQMKRYAGFLMERVCKYGCAKIPRWCDDCSQKERHALGQFRGLGVPEETMVAGEEPAKPADRA